MARLNEYKKMSEIFLCGANHELQIEKGLQSYKSSSGKKHTLWLAGCLPTDQDTSCTSSKVYQ